MSIIINTLSACSFFTEIYFNDIKLSSATSFAFSYKGQAFLVTNYHVAFGKNPHSQSVLNQYGAIPNKIVFYYYADNNELMSQTIRFAEYENPFGFFTSEKGEILDIAVLKLNDFNGICINEAHKYNTRLTYDDKSLKVTDELFVLGYPNGIDVKYTPIWKRSTIATEPQINVGGLPVFYIDSTTRQGMSGAPVIRYNSTGADISRGIIQLSNHESFQLVGLYSGRDFAGQDYEAQLGRVWRKEQIEKIIALYYDRVCVQE